MSELHQVFARRRHLPRLARVTWHGVWILFVLLAGAVALAAQFVDLQEPFGHSPAKSAPSETQAWLRRLGKGPVYRIDILYRHSEDGVLYYCQTLISPDQPDTGRIPGFGLNARGQPILPPDPGYARVQTLAVAGQPKTEPALAETTRHLGVSLRADDGEQGQAMIRVSDIATGMPLPAKAGESQVAFFAHALFRIEMLSARQVAAVVPLRQDATAYRQRTAALRQELFSTHQDALTADGALPDAVRVFPEASLINRLRKGLADWIDEPADMRGFPHPLCGALAAVSVPADFDLFHRLVRRWPEYRPHASEPIFIMLKRHGGREAVPLLRDLLEDEAIAELAPNVVLLRRLDRSVPAPTHGDRMLQRWIEAFGLKPGDFGFRLAQARLLEQANRYPFEPRELQTLQRAVRDGRGDWLLLGERDRRRAVALALEQIRAYDKPAGAAGEP